MPFDGLSARFEGVDGGVYLENYALIWAGRLAMFKVLIAEDDADLRQLFQHVLIQNGYYVKGVSNGQEGLDELEKDSYDLIISDIMMPVMDGYTFIRTLREQGKNMPVLTITAKDAFNDVCTGGNPQPITEEDILALYKKVY